MTHRLPLVATAIAAALAVALSGCAGGGSAGATKKAAAILHGAVPDQHLPRPEFNLVDTSGKAYDFKARTTGRVTMLYFGYTHCPDQCPTSMADLATALRRVPADVASQVTVVFVTTDPWRDTKPVLRRWLDKFSSSFIGLTGTPTQIAGAEVQMGMPISRRVPGKKGSKTGGYSVDHFAAVMAYGRDNQLATLYPSGVAPSDIAADMSALVKE